MASGVTSPINRCPFRPPPSAGNAEDQILNQMFTSAWASPVCLVRKPDGSFCFCIDYSWVNPISLRDAFSIPEIEDALDSLPDRGLHYVFFSLFAG